MLRKRLVTKIKRWFYLRMASLCGIISRKGTDVEKQFFWFKKQQDYLDRLSETYYHIWKEES